MTCRQLQQRLSAHVDGDLTAGEAARVSAHLRECNACAQVAQQLEQIKLAARELPRHQPPDAMLSRTLAAMDQAAAPRWWIPTAGALVAATAVAAVVLWWPSTRRQGPAVVQDRLAGRAGQLGQRPDAALGRTTIRHATRTPDATTMHAARLADAGGPAKPEPRKSARSSAIAVSRKEFRQAEAHYARSVAQLRAIADGESKRWSETRRRRYQRDLQMIEQGLARVRAAAQSSAADPHAQELLFSTYRQEIDYLSNSILGDVDQDSPKRVPTAPPVVPVTQDK